MKVYLLLENYPTAYEEGGYFPIGVYRTKEKAEEKLNEVATVGCKYKYEIIECVVDSDKEIEV